MRYAARILTGTAGINQLLAALANGFKNMMKWNWE
jgi:hypothetical protein